MPDDMPMHLSKHMPYHMSENMCINAKQFSQHVSTRFRLLGETTRQRTWNESHAYISFTYIFVKPIQTRVKVDIKKLAQDTPGHLLKCVVWDSRSTRQHAWEYICRKRKVVHAKAAKTRRNKVCLYRSPYVFSEIHRYLLPVWISPAIPQIKSLQSQVIVAVLSDVAPQAYATLLSNVVNPTFGMMMATFQPQLLYKERIHNTNQPYQ